MMNSRADEVAKEIAEADHPWDYIWAMLEAGVLTHARPGVKGIRLVHVKKTDAPPR